MANPNKIEVGDQVNVLDPGAEPIAATVVALPDNQLAYWIMRGPAPNLNLFYVPVDRYLIQVVQKIP